jgi:hypothetical protein
MCGVKVVPMAATWNICGLGSANPNTVLLAAALFLPIYRKIMEGFPPSKSQQGQFDFLKLSHR